MPTESPENSAPTLPQSANSTAQQTSLHLVFAGMIDQLAAQRVFSTTTIAIQNGINDIHLLLQTSGGNIGDAVCVYNFLKSFPAKITIYNVGSIASAGVIAYLGGHVRKVSRRATFMIHRSSATMQQASKTAMQARVESLIIDDRRVESILREHITGLSDEKWAIHDAADLWLTADEAKDSGLAHEVAEFEPPLGSPVYNVLG